MTGTRSRRYGNPRSNTGAIVDWPGVAAEYVGSDGTIVISRRTLEGYAAIDTSSCQTLWQLPGAKRIDIRKVGTGLVRIDHEQQTISSLRPPH